MTSQDTWITYADGYPDLLELMKGFGQTSTLKFRSPYFPDGHLAASVVRRGISDGRFRGAQVDPLVWAALMSKAELLAFLDEVYGDPGEYERRFERGPLRHMAERLKSLRAYVAELPENEQFAVVADEF